LVGEHINFSIPAPPVPLKTGEFRAPRAPPPQEKKRFADLAEEIDLYVLKEIGVDRW
jgi:hypothetical protein